MILSRKTKVNIIEQIFDAQDWVVPEVLISDALEHERREVINMLMAHNSINESELYNAVGEFLFSDIVYDPDVQHFHSSDIPDDVKALIKKNMKDLSDMFGIRDHDLSCPTVETTPEQLHVVACQFMELLMSKLCTGVVIWHDEPMGKFDSAKVEQYKNRSMIFNLLIEKLLIASDVGFYKDINQEDWCV